MNRAAIKQLEARSEELLERLAGAEKVIEEILGSRRHE